MGGKKKKYKKRRVRHTNNCQKNSLNCRMKKRFWFFPAIMLGYTRLPSKQRQECLLIYIRECVCKYVCVCVCVALKGEWEIQRAESKQLDTCIIQLVGTLTHARRIYLFHFLFISLDFYLSLFSSTLLFSFLVLSNSKHPLKAWYWHVPCLATCKPTQNTFSIFSFGFSDDLFLPQSQLFVEMSDISIKISCLSFNSVSRLSDGHFFFPFGKFSVQRDTFF